MGSLILASNPLFGAASDGRGFYVFGLEIYYYALCIVSGMICAAVLSALLMKRRNMSSDFIFLLFICCIPTALVTARLFSCLTERGLSILDFFKFRDGGLSIIGGVVGGVAMGLVVCLARKVNFLRAADCVVPTIFFAMTLGRWGNFFNGEVYGGVVPAGMEWFPFAVPIDGTSGIGAFSNPGATWHYAFFFYESVLDLIFGGLLYSAAWYWKKKPNGVFACSYFLFYGIVRTIMEPLRDTKFQLGNASLVMAIIYIVVGAVGIGVLLGLNYYKEGAVFGSKTGDPCGITEYLSPYKNDKPYYSKINMFGDKYPPKPEQEESKFLLWWKKVLHIGGKNKTDGNADPDENADNSAESPVTTTEEGEKSEESEKKEDRKEE